MPCCAPSCSYAPSVLRSSWPSFSLCAPWLISPAICACCQPSVFFQRSESSLTTNLLEQFTVKLDSHLDRVIRPNPAFKRPGRQYGQIVCLAQLVSSHDKPFRNRSRPCSDITNPLKLS